MSEHVIYGPDEERLVPRDLDQAPHHPDGGGPAFVTGLTTGQELPLSAGDGISRGDVDYGAIAHDLDVREFRARTAISVALGQLEGREFPPEPCAADFRRQAATIRGAARNINEALVELASIAGEYDAHARGL